MLNKNPIYYEVLSMKGNRYTNQDRFVIGRTQVSSGDDVYIEKIMSTEDFPIIFAVADGVSSEDKSEQAAALALSVMQKAIYEHNGWNNYANDTILKIIQDGASRANQAVLGLTESFSNHYATTISLLILNNGFYYAANIGDSPIYHVADGKVNAIYKAHTVAQIKKDRGQVPSASDYETLQYYLGNYIYSGEEMVEITYGKYNINDTFLICSDGLMKVQSQRELCYSLLPTNKPFLKDICESKDYYNFPDNCTAIRIRMNRIDTMIQLEHLERCESDTEYRREYLSKPERYFENWEQILATHYTNKKKLIDQIARDWDISRRTAINWIKKRPSRDNVIRICISMSLNLEQTNRVLAHDAHYGTLEFADEDDLVWIYLINSLWEGRENVKNYKELKDVFEEKASNTRTLEPGRRAVVADRINGILRENNLSINVLWNESGHHQVKKSYEILAGKPKKGQLFPRQWIIAFSIKLGFRLDSINEFLLMSGMDPLRSKDIFEATLIYVLTSLELTQPALFYDEKYPEMDGSFDLAEAVAGRLTQFSNYLTGIYKSDFDISWSELKNYL